MASKGNCFCCGTCSEILAEDLPELVIAGMTGFGWVKSGCECCWSQTFSPTSDPPILFTDGGELQLDSHTTTQTNRAFLLKTSRPEIWVDGGIQRVDSGGPYPVLTVGPADWRINGNGNGTGTAPDWIYVAGTRPECPTCVGPVDCVIETATSTYYQMQRWGIRTKAQGITVYLQKVKTTCTSPPTEEGGPEAVDAEPSCKLIMTCVTEILYQPVFRWFYRSTVSKTYTDSGCCDGISPEDSESDSGWADFGGGGFDPWTNLPDWPSLPLRTKIVSQKILEDLEAQSITFGPGICVNCVLEDSGVEYCEDCQGDGCFTAAGTGEVSGDFCDPKLATHVTCTEGWAIGCRDGSVHTWDDGVTVCTTFAPLDAIECDDYTFDLYTFTPVFPFGCPAYGSQYHQFIVNVVFLPPSLILSGVGPILNLATCGESPTSDVCPSTPFLGDVYPSGYEPLSHVVGTMDGLSYSASCSGAIEQTVCVGTNWTVTIL